MLAPAPSNCSLLHRNVRGKALSHALTVLQNVSQPEVLHPEQVLIIGNHVFIQEINILPANDARLTGTLFDATLLSLLHRSGLHLTSLCL